MKSTPKVPDGALLTEYVQKNWGAHPKTEVLPWLRSLWTGIATFPCHPKTPESGPMFVLALVLTVLLPRARAIGFAMLFCLGCLVTWNSTYVQGRNLQGILPIVAMATGAALLRGFRIGGVAKLARLALCWRSKSWPASMLPSGTGVQSTGDWP